MDLGNCLLFCSGAALLTSLGFVVGATLLPPDVYSQVLVGVPSLVVACAVAYWAVFRDGLADLERALHGEH